MRCRLKSIRPAPLLPLAPRGLSAGARALALALCAGCAGSDPSPAPPQSPAPAAPLSGPSPAARSMEIRGALEDARSLWEEGDRDGARDRVLLTYQQSFEPMEPLLSRLDPMGTLEIEYAFGALAVQLSKRGEPMSAQVSIRALTDRVEAAVEAIPPEALPPEAQQQDELLGPPPVAVEARPPTRGFKTYGEGTPN